MLQLQGLKSTTRLTNIFYSDIKEIPNNTGESKRLISSQQGCRITHTLKGAFPEVQVPGMPVPHSLHPAWPKDMWRLEIPLQADEWQIKSTWNCTELLLSPSSNTTERKGGNTKGGRKKIQVTKQWSHGSPKATWSPTSAQSRDSITWRYKNT